jgi:hypothetical protein
MNSVKPGSATETAPVSTVLSIAGAILLAVAMWYYILIIWLPPVNLHFSDFYPSWYATRELFLHHRDPYGLDVAQDIQAWIYGHPNVPGSGRSVHDHQFVYPAYVCFLLWPFSKFNFGTAENVMLLMLAICTVASVLLWLRALKWQVSPTMLTVVSVLTLGSCPAAQGLYLRQLGLLAATMLAATAAAVTAGKLRVGGMLLALATIKPQLSVLVVVWLLIWCTGDWKLRKSFFWSFLTSMAVITAATTIALPSWPGEFWKAVQAYPEYNDGRSIIQLLLGPTLGQVCGALIVIGLLVVVWMLRRVAAETDSFVLILSLMLSTTLMVIPTMAPHGQVLLLPGALWLWRERSRIRRLGRAARYILASVWLLLGTQWLLALLLTTGALILSAEAVRRFWILPFSVAPVVPLMFSVALVLPLLAKLRTAVATAC